MKSQKSCLGRGFWLQDSEDTNEENGEDNVSPKNSVDKWQPVRGSAVPEPVTTSKEQIEASERIVATWLQIQLFEGLYARGMSKGSMTIARDGYHQKRLDQTYRRHLSAIRALAQIRKLLKGTAITQINIAEKQINTAGQLSSDHSR